MEYDMEYNTEGYSKPEPDKNNMATAAMVLGIISLPLICSCYGGFILGSLAIIFALLSRTEETFESQAKTGLILGTIALVISTIIAITFIGLLILTGFEQYRSLPPVPDFKEHMPNLDNLLTVFINIRKAGGI